MLRHLIRPDSAGTVYLCAHAVRSKWTLRNGTAEIAGGYRVWRQQGLPSIQ